MSMQTLYDDHFDTFKQAFYVAAFWAESLSNGTGESLDSVYELSDLDSYADEMMDATATILFNQLAPFIDAEKEPKLSDDGTGRWSHAGYDAWLTLAGHGAGFGDGDWPFYGDVLTERCKSVPALELYDDPESGKVYV